MGKRGAVFSVVFTLVLIVAVLHTFVHFAVHGTGIYGFAEKGVSGLSIGRVDFGEELSTRYSVRSNISRLFVILEWVVLLGSFVFVFTRGKISMKNDFKELKVRKSKLDMKGKTDLDRLYEFLKEKKRLKVSTVAKVFEVNKSVVESWARTLESGELAAMSYPRFGEPEIVIKEKVDVKA